MSDLQLDIIDALSAGQTRSLVELGIDLGVSYERLAPAIGSLSEKGLIELDHDQRQTIYRLVKSHSALY